MRNAWELQSRQIIAIKTRANNFLPNDPRYVGNVTKHGYTNHPQLLGGEMVGLAATKASGLTSPHGAVR